MAEISMSPKELMFLAANLGAKNFYGVKDPFHGLTRSEVLAERPDIMMKLESRGLLSMDFDGNVTVAPVCTEIVNTCAFCDIFISIGGIDPEGNTIGLVYYSKDNKTVLLKKEIDKVILSMVDKSNITEGILKAAFAKEVDTDERTAPFVLAPNVLGQIADIPENEAVALLTEKDCPDKMTRILVNGLKKRGKLVILEYVDLVRRKAESLICVSTKEGMIQLCVNKENGLVTDNWEVDYTSKKRLYSILNAMIYPDTEAQNS